MDTGKVVISVLAGAAIGAVLGILLAPAKGAVLRRKIRMMGDKEADVIKEKINEFTDTVSQNYEKVKGSVVDFTHKNEAKVKTAENN